MSEAAEWAVRAVVIGIGATVVLDLWSLFLKRAFALPTTNWAMVGRWVGHLLRGRFKHDAIAAAAMIPGEHALGWATHYATGVGYAALLLAIAGLDWARAPTLTSALLFGLATIAAPFFIMQPGMGAGIMASRSPNPTLARLRTLMAHTVFGIGLYLAAVATAGLF